MWASTNTPCRRLIRGSVGKVRGLVQQPTCLVALPYLRVAVRSLRGVTHALGGMRAGRSVGSFEPPGVGPGSALLTCHVRLEVERLSGKCAAVRLVGQLQGVIEADNGFRIVPRGRMEPASKLHVFRYDDGQGVTVGAPCLLQHAPHNRHLCLRRADHRDGADRVV